MRKSILLILITVLVMSESCATSKDTAAIVSIETTYGKITVKLYPETPNHRANFLKLVNKGFYDGLLFHRVIADFMIQCGDPDSKIAKPGTTLGSGDVAYTIPAEFVYSQYYHKRGALSAARQSDQTNPLKSSSGCQFYIVQGRTFSDAELNGMEMKNQQKLEEKLFQSIINTKQEEIKKYRLERNQTKLDALHDTIEAKVHVLMQNDTSFKFTEKQRNDYKILGGTPHLDGEYTVFGEVIEGLEVVERISQTKTGLNDRPVENIRVIKAEVIR